MGARKKTILNQKYSSYAGITQIRLKGQYLYGIQSQPANSSTPTFYMHLHYIKSDLHVYRDHYINPQLFDRYKRVYAAFCHSL